MAEEKNPIIEKALKKGSKSGGDIGDIGGGTGEKVTSTGGGSGGSGSGTRSEARRSGGSAGNKAYLEEKGIIETKQENQTQALNKERRNIAQNKVGEIRRVTTNPITGEVTYQGTKGKYTFPKEGTAYSGANKYGGIQSKERPYYGGTVSQPQKLSERTRNISAEKSANKTGGLVYPSLMQRTGNTARETYFYEKAPVTKGKAGQPQVIYDVPGPNTKVRSYESLSKEEKKAYNSEILNKSLFYNTTYQDVIKNRSIKKNENPQSSYYFGFIPKTNEEKFKVLDEKPTRENFEQRSYAFSELEKRFYNSPGFKQISKAAGYITQPWTWKANLNIPAIKKENGNIELYSKTLSIGYGLPQIPLESRGTIGRMFQKLGDMPKGIIGTVMFAPKKIQFVTEAAVYSQREGWTSQLIEQLNPNPIKLELNLPAIKKENGNIELYSKNVNVLQPTGIGKILSETVYNPRTDEGKMTYIFAAVGGYFKAKADIKAGKVGPLQGKTEYNIKTTTYKTPIQETLKVANVGKKGNIQTVEYSPTIQWTVQGKRVTPESYAKILQSEDKLSLNYTNFLDPETVAIAPGVATHVSTTQGNFYPYENIINLARIQRVTAIRGTGRGRPYQYNVRMFTPDELRSTLSHELIHYKTQRFNIPGEENLPYRLQPQEIIAWTLEKTMARKGFAVSPKQISRYRASNSFDITVRADEPLKFNYNRMQVIESATGKNNPAVTISTGTIKRGFMEYDYRSVQIGREVSGTMINKYMDIFFKKDSSGNLLVRYLRKEPKTNRIIREFNDQATAKLPMGLKANLEKNIVIKEFTTGYKTESIKFNQNDIINIREPKTIGFDVGQKYDGIEIYPNRMTGKQADYRITGIKTQFNQGKDILKAVYGKATSSTFQIDKAGFQKEVYKSPNLFKITLRPSDIEYVIQPIYKQSLTRKGTTTDRQPFLLSIERPPVITKRTYGFVSEVTYIYKTSGLKPLKAIRESFKEFRSDYYSSLYKNSNNSSLIIDPFKLAVEKRTIGKPVKVQIEKPSINLIPESGSILRPKTIINILPKSNNLIIPISTLRLNNKSLSMSKSRLEVFSRSSLDIRLNNVQRSYSEQKTFNLSKQKTFTQQRINQRTQTQQTEKLLTPSTVGTYNRLSNPLIKPPTKIPILLLPPTNQKEKKKTSKGKSGINRAFEYQPSLVGQLGNFPRTNQQLFTGIEIRGV